MHPLGGGIDFVSAEREQKRRKMLYPLGQSKKKVDVASAGRGQKTKVDFVSAVREQKQRKILDS